MFFSVKSENINGCPTKNKLDFLFLAGSNICKLSYVSADF